MTPGKAPANTMSRSVHAQGCGPGGELVNTQQAFNGWKAKWNLDYADDRLFAPPTPTFAISISEAATYTASPMRMGRLTTSAITRMCGGSHDTDLLSVQRGENLVACVAMEHSPTPGVSGGRSFTGIPGIRTGRSKALPSVNLDQRGEKFLPGVLRHLPRCAPRLYRFDDENPSMSPDLGTVPPFDLDNFAYASNGPLSRAGQEAQFRSLNLTLLKTDPRPACTRRTAQSLVRTLRQHLYQCRPTPGWSIGRRSGRCEDKPARTCRADVRFRWTRLRLPALQRFRPLRVRARRAGLWVHQGRDIARVGRCPTPR